jgi:hypothetical protein
MMQPTQCTLLCQCPCCSLLSARPHAQTTGITWTKQIFSFEPLSWKSQLYFQHTSARSAAQLLPQTYRTHENNRKPDTRKSISFRDKKEHNLNTSALRRRHNNTLSKHFYSTFRRLKVMNAILGTFAKFRKASISLVIYVRPSEWNTERIFAKIYT